MISLAVLRRCAALLAALAVLAAADAPDATAQGYSVYADCNRSDGWIAASNPGFSAYRNCEGGWLSGMKTLVTTYNDDRTGTGSGIWRFGAPGGTKIIGLQWSGNKYHGVLSAGWVGGGWAFRTGMFGDGFRGVDPQAECYTHNLGACYSGALSNPNAKSVPSHYVGGLNESIVGFYTQCVPAPNACPTNSDGLSGHNYTRAGLVVSNMRVDLRDDWNPNVGGLVEVTPAGAGGWHRGNVTVRFDASDNSGIERTAVHRSGGASLASRPRPCDSYRLTPCSNYSGADGEHVIDTTELSDGRHPLTGVAWDAAGRSATTAVNEILVDNNAPAKPPTVSIDGGDDWSSDRSRTVRWSRPSQGSGSPIARFYTRTCKVGGACVDSTVNDAGATAWNGAAPTAGPGEYTVRIALGDQAGLGEWSDPVTFRFDDRAPGAAEETRANGWQNAVERAAYQQHVRMKQDAFEPISGIAGYSITTDGSDPDNTVEAAGEVADFPINNLPEGVNIVKARAVSGAGVGSALADVDSIEVKVDVSRPMASVEGAPGATKWQNKPVDLDLKGVDQPNLSGMEPGPGDKAVEEGAYIAYRIDDGERQLVRGDSAHVTVGDEGEHTITYYAVDFAGNESETRTVHFKIDRTSPVAGATSDAIDPAAWQREAVTATLTGDDGFGRSGMDPAPEGEPVEHGGHLVYRLNTGTIRKAPGASATFKVEEDGDHAVEYYAVDAAGNESEHKTLRFRIDRTAPTGVAIEQLGSDRRRIEVDAADATSGVGEVQIGLRRVAERNSLRATKRLASRAPKRYRSTRLRRTRRIRNGIVRCGKKRPAAKRACLRKRRKQLTRHRIASLGANWLMLPASLEGGKWVAYLPQDRSLEPGVYQLQAVAQDRAGNERSADRFRSGAPAIIDPCLVPAACRPGAEKPRNPQDPVSGGSRGSGGGGTGRAPLDLGPDAGTVDTRVTAGGIRKVKVKTNLPRKCKRPRTRALKKRCAKARRARYRQVFVSKLKVGFRRAAAVKGTLTTAAGAPVAGGTLDVIVTPNAAGHSPRIVGAVTSDAAGAFTYKAPRGTSRRIVFRFRGLGQYRRSEGTVDVLVPGAATLKSSKRRVANGQSVVFTGKLLSKPLPKRGKVVDLQVFYRGKWRTFGTPRAGRKGRFKFRYRFEATRRTTVYRFRARLRAESAYPYELGYSKVVAVKVRGT